jgi:two-component system LytT family sensor kinase
MVIAALLGAAMLRYFYVLAQWQARLAAVTRAEVEALQARIRPHFLFNSMNTVAALIRVDPAAAERTVEDLCELFRAALGQHDTDNGTLGEELALIERYLLLEQARFGERLTVTLKIAPEVLGVRIPFLCLQPLVENAVRHGLEKHESGGTISIEARDVDRECEISVEDDGAGEDPERIRRVLAGDAGSDSVGRANVDERLRNTFGDEYGLVVETAPGAGTKVTVRVPKYAPGVHP